MKQCPEGKPTLGEAGHDHPDMKKIEAMLEQPRTDTS
jgi:hypothetical protein